MKETKSTQGNQCPLADDTHCIWNCPLFNNLGINDRYLAVGKQRLRYHFWEKDIQTQITRSTSAV